MSNVESIDIDPMIAAELSDDQYESLQKLLARFAHAGSRIILNVVGPMPTRPDSITYGHVVDDQAEQFSGGIKNSAVGMPVWE